MRYLICVILLIPFVMLGRLNASEPPVVLYPSKDGSYLFYNSFKKECKFLGIIGCKKVKETKKYDLVDPVVRDFLISHGYVCIKGQ